MFRDEADILNEFFTHWSNVGVTDFYACDNGSKDNSYDIALKYCKVLIKDSRTNWPGREVINSLKTIALEKHQWIFPVDADEFIQLPEQYQSIHDWLDTYNVDDYAWGEVKYLNILPNGYKEFQEPHRKVFGKLKSDWMISMGNHIIESIKPTLSSKGVYYNHYSLRTFDQFKTKMINYMTAFHDSAFQDHPHAVDYHLWKEQGDEFLLNRWNTLTNYP